MRLTYNSAMDTIYFPQSRSAKRPNGGENIPLINQVFERIAIAKTLRWEDLENMLFRRINSDDDNFPGGCSVWEIKEFIDGLKPRFEPASPLADDDHIIIMNIR